MPRGRPRNVIAPLELELRITPPDGEPITDWQIDDSIEQLVSFQEGGDEKKLHYHCYIKCTMSRPTLTKWIYKISRCNNGESGNAVFYSRKPHAHTFGYIAKNKTISIRHGLSQTFIEEWFKESDEYKKQRESKRKRDQRDRSLITLDIRQQVAEDLKQGTINKDVSSIVERLIQLYHENNLTFPPRSQIEQATMTLLYPYNSGYVQGWYARNLILH